MNNEILNEDILRELFNTSVGKSASILSEIIKKKLLLNVPAIKLLNPINCKSELDNCISKVIDGSIMISSICFNDKLVGKASLLLPASEMRHFINLCIHENGNNMCNKDLNFTEVEFDIIKEAGNIVLNSVVIGFSNYVNIKVSYTLPEINVFKERDVEKIIEEENEHILMLYITFNIENFKINGAIIINWIEKQ